MGDVRRLVIAGAAVLALAILAAVLLAPRIMDAAAPEAEQPPFAEQAPLPRAAAEPTGPGVAGLVDPDWAAATAAATGIPQRALLAYAGAALQKAAAMPECGLGWNTLAGIGLVESDHGRHGGSSVGPDGTVTPPIFGIALDGPETDNIPDSDDGAIDGDATVDRAVGPMQLIPQTWTNWHTDGSGDGVEDPQNIDDAVVAASNYLCRASDDMASEEGWLGGVSSYNSADSYARAVASAAQRYADQ